MKRFAYSPNVSVRLGEKQALIMHSPSIADCQRGQAGAKAKRLVAIANTLIEENAWLGRASTVFNMVVMRISSRNTIMTEEQIRNFLDKCTQAELMQQ